MMIKETNNELTGIAGSKWITIAQCRRWPAA